MDTTAPAPFFTGALSRQAAEKHLKSALAGADDGELFLESRQSELLGLDDGRLKVASFDAAQGFGLRAVKGEATAYAHANEISESALKRAAETVSAISRSGSPASLSLSPPGTNRALYGAENPLGSMEFEAKVALLQELDAFARAADPRVAQVSASISGEWQAIEILRPDGFCARDIRPLVRISVSVMLRQNGRQETGSFGMGGREGYTAFLAPARWQAAVKEAIRQAEVALAADAAPAGEMDVVLGPGWPGILLHEAIGHGLEGDFNRKKTSVFTGLIGTRIASPGVNVVDDGTIAARRGSISIDDEGTPSQTTPLIEDGILVGYMQDRLNARLMGMKATGNGRRESYAHSPMPRMTNTVMLSGKHDPAEMIASMKNGLYAVNFGGGQVDITSGKFVFSCTEAYRIENGRVTSPVKGATLIGAGADALTRISMIGNDSALDPGIGTCGKQGQGVPVGVGQPSLRLDRITVGGTAA